MPANEHDDRSMLSDIAWMLDLPATAAFRGPTNIPLYLSPHIPPAASKFGAWDRLIDLASQEAAKRGEIESFSNHIRALAWTEHQALLNVEDLQEQHRVLTESLQNIQASRDQAGRRTALYRAEIADIERRFREQIDPTLGQIAGALTSLSPADLHFLIAQATLNLSTRALAIQSGIADREHRVREQSSFAVVPDYILLALPSLAPTAPFGMILRATTHLSTQAETIHARYIGLEASSGSAGSTETPSASTMSPQPLPSSPPAAGRLRGSAAPDSDEENQPSVRCRPDLPRTLEESSTRPAQQVTAKKRAMGPAAEAPTVHVPATRTGDQLHSSTSESSESDRIRGNATTGERPQSFFALLHNQSTSIRRSSNPGDRGARHREIHK